MESEVLEHMGCGEESVGGHREWRVVSGGHGEESVGGGKVWEDIGSGE